MPIPAWKLFITLALILTLNACAKNIAGRKQVMLVSEASAIEASSQAYINTLEPFKKAGKLDNNAATVQRINDITNRLIIQARVKRPDTAGWQWSVKVIDDPNTINAWCMAGGKMAFYTGLIAKLNVNDDEIAQIMGHEISHALANHSAERMSIAMASKATLDLIQAATGAGEGSMSLATAAAQVAVTLPNSRTSETEADSLGIELAARAGYDPNAAVTLWQKMAQVSGQGGFEFMSTHPAPGNREQALRALIPSMMPLYQAAKRQ